MLKFGFETLNLHRIELKVFAFNPRALRCYEKGGFKKEGPRRHVHFHEDQYHDAYYMGILQEEFADHRA